MNVPSLFTSIQIHFQNIDPGDQKSLPSIAFMLSIKHFKHHVVKDGISFLFRLPKGEVIYQFIKSGYRPHAEFVFIQYQDFIVFSKQ